MSGRTSVAADNYLNKTRGIQEFIKQQNREKANLQQILALNERNLEQIQKMAQKTRRLYDEMGNDIRKNRKELLDFVTKTAQLKRLGIVQGLGGNTEKELRAVYYHMQRVMGLMDRYDKGRDMKGRFVKKENLKAMKDAAKDELFVLSELAKRLEDIAAAQKSRGEYGAKHGMKWLAGAEKEVILRKKIVDLLGARKQIEEKISAARDDAEKQREIFHHQKNVEGMNRTLFQVAGGANALKYMDMFSKLVDGIRSVRALGLGLAGFIPMILSVATRLMNILWSTTKQVMRTFVDAGFSADQFYKATAKINEGMMDLRKRGLIGFDTEFAKAIAEARAALAPVMGDTAPSNAVINNMIEMNRVFKVSLDTAAQFVTTMDTISKGDDKFGNRANTWLQKTAGVLGVTYRDLAESLAQNSELMYRYGQRGYEMLVKQAGVLKTMRVDMGAMSGFMDGIINDFSGWLDRQAKLQTAIPGLNLDDVMYESYFGTEVGVAKALKAALNERGITSVSDNQRAIQNIVQSNLGLSFKDIENILAGRGKDASFESIEKFNEASVVAQTQMLDSLGSDGLIVHFLRLIYDAITPLRWLNPTKWGRSLMGMDSPDTPDRYDITSGAALNYGQFHQPRKYHSGGIISSLARKLLPNEIPAILQKGETVLTGLQLKGLGSLMEGVKSISKIGTQFKSMLGDKIGNITKSITTVLGKDGILGNVAKAFSSSGSGGLLGSVTGLLGGNSSGILSKVGGLLGGSGGGILGKIGGLFGGGSGGLLGSIGSKLGLGNILGGAAGGPLGIAASLAMPVLSKLPVVGGLFGGASKAIGGAIGKVGGFIGGLFGKKKKPEPQQQAMDPYQALQQMAMMGGLGMMGGLPGMGMMAMPATMTAGAMKTDTSKIETLLSELITAVRSKTVIKMDGFKVGEAIMSANRGL